MEAEAVWMPGIKQNKLIIRITFVQCNKFMLFIVYYVIILFKNKYIAYKICNVHIV